MDPNLEKMLDTFLTSEITKQQLVERARDYLNKIHGLCGTAAIVELDDFIKEVRNHVDNQKTKE